MSPICDEYPFFAVVSDLRDEEEVLCWSAALANYGISAQFDGERAYFRSREHAQMAVRAIEWVHTPWADDDRDNVAKLATMLEDCIFV